MPLHGKIVVIKRSGGDGTEFPLTAACLFGRKPDCDIRIQLPQVSKEHCRIDLNENKEVMLTNLSLVNPTRINGDAMKQAQRLKHGDVITIIDRSFRFEYPPAPTPKKKRPSLAGKSEILQVADPGTLITGERRKSSELTSDSSCLKDGTNTSNVHALAVEDYEDSAKEADQTGPEQRKPSDKESRSPFCELYQMVKQNLSMKSPRRPAEAAQPKTPLSRREPQKTVEVKTVAEETGGAESTPQVGQSTPRPKKMTKEKRRSSVGCAEQMDSTLPESRFGGEATPKSTKRRSKVSSESSLEVSVVSALPAEGQVEDSSQPVATPSKAAPEESRRSLGTPAKQSVPEEKGTPTSQKKPQQGIPQKFCASEVARQIVSENSVSEETFQSTENSKTPKRRRSKGSTVLPCQNSAETPGTPGTPHSLDSHDVLELKRAQCESEAEMSEAVQKEKSPKAKDAASPRRVSPRKSPGKKLQASDVLLELESTAPPSGDKSVNAGTSTSSGKKRKSGKLESDLPGPQLKRKRVSFGGQLSPELFDKRLPPNSPLRRGATPGRRSLSALRETVLRGSFPVGLMEELSAEASSPKSKTPKRSPGKKASPESVSPAKSPKTKAKTPSPKKSEVRNSVGPKSPAETSSQGKSSPSTQDPVVPKGRKSLSPGKKTPQTPLSGKTPIKQLNGTPNKESPLTSTKTPSEPVLADVGSPSSTPVTSGRRRRSVSDALKMSPGQSAAEMPKTPLPVEKASGSTAKTPSPGMFFRECFSFNQTPSVKGRFSVSRISTPSPVADQATGAVEMSTCVTPSVPLRRKSMKSTSKKTPKSARKSVLEVIRSRRSGASRANFKVVSSWADIVKFGVSKPQTSTTTKKCTRKATTVKKTVVKKPKTPAKKIKEHFSTGHAASPATIVVGKAHTKVAQTAGCAPKIVHNIALLRKNMKINEDLSGIAEIFRTPVNVQKRIQNSDRFCPETPKANATSCTEFSVMDTPEEMGEMVVSPLSVISTEKHGVYDNEAIAWLLQDQDSSMNCDDAHQESDSVMTALVTEEPVLDPVPKRGIRTPKQKAKSLTCLTEVKRIMKTPKQKVQQVEDLRGIKRLLKTPREPKVSQEVSLVGVKEVMKTPKIKTTPLVCTTGVKRLMKTPKQKGEPVEDMIGLKRLMQTPKQKVEPVEDLTGVKQLMKTPKEKGQPVESHFGIRRLMKSPRQKGVAVDDFTGLQELMEEPSDYLPSEVGFKECETSEEKVSEMSAAPQFEKSVPALGEAEMASKEESIKLMPEETKSNATKKSVRGRLQKQVENISGDDANNGDPAKAQNDAEINSAGDVDQNLPEEKPKRGRQARQVAATVIKRTRQKISEIKEEPISSVVAAPIKSTRRKGAKKLEEFEKATIEEKQSENMEFKMEGGDEVRSSDMEIAEEPVPDLVPAKGRRGKKTKEIPQNDTSTAPVRKIGRGKKAKVTDVADESYESDRIKCIEMSPATKKIDDAPETMPAPVPIIKPRRGRKPKQAETSEVDNSVAQAMESIVSDAKQSDIGNCLPESKEEVPVVKSGRGRKAKAVVPEVQTSLEVLPKRGRRGAVDSLASQTVASPAPSLKSGRGRGRKAQNLDSTAEVTSVQAEISSTECSTKSPKKVRGTRRQAKISDSVALDVPSAPLDGDCIPDTSSSNDLVKNGRGKAGSRKAGVLEADRNVETATSIKNVKRAPAKKSVNWTSALAISHTTEIAVSPSSEEGSQQRRLMISEGSTAGLAENGSIGVDETKVNLEPQPVPRRGRAGKKSAVQPTEQQGSEPYMEKAQSTRKGRTQAVKPKSDPVKDDVPLAKRGTKRKLTQKDTDEVTGDNDSTSESVSLDSLPKRARGRTTKVDETKIEDKSNKAKRGTAKKSGKALAKEVEETKPIMETPRPARRGGRKMAQDDVKPVPAQEECPTKRKRESAKQTATRGRAKAEKKADSTRSEEARPVRRTRQK